jgi:nuclear pore complex protein Nup160
LEGKVLCIEFTKNADYQFQSGKKLSHWGLLDGPVCRVYGTRCLCVFVSSPKQPVALMAAATAADKVLISTHLADVYSPLQTAAISISTSKPHVPFPPQASDDEPPPEHAQYAAFFHSVQTGVILLRLIHNGLIVELLSLSTETPPIRFVFPYTVLPNPAIVLWETRELHILAVTASGSLFRIVLPIQTPQQLWSLHMVNNWCREYHLKHVKEHLQALVQVQGTHSVALALTNGSLIRLDAENIGDKTSAGASVFLAFSFPLF